MKVWSLTAPKTLQLIESPTEDLKDNQHVKIKIERALLSYTDISVYNSTLVPPSYPVVLGRHAVGVISDSFDQDKNLNKGERVVIEPYISCNDCYFCKTDRATECQHMQVMGLNANGFYRNFITLPIANIHKLPDNLDLNTALFTDYVSLALNVIDQLNIEKGDHVAVLSVNKLGYILAQLLSYYQAVPIVIDDNEAYLDKLKDVGIPYVFNSSKCKAVREVFNITGGRMCKKVIYSTNFNIRAKDALDLCSFHGQLCLAGVIPDADNADLSVIFAKHLTVHTITRGNGNYPSAINLLSTNAIDVTALSSKGCSFEQVPEFFASLEPQSIKYCSPIIEF